jgi:hypothetical protein
MTASQYNATYSPLIVAAKAIIKFQPWKLAVLSASCCSPSLRLNDVVHAKNNNSNNTWVVENLAC